MLAAALTPNQARIFRSRISLSRVGLRWTWVSMIVGITVLPARLTRKAPAGTATPWPACTILLPSMTSVAFSTTFPLPTISRTPSNAVTSASAGLAKAATIAASAIAFSRRIGTPIGRWNAFPRLCRLLGDLVLQQRIDLEGITFEDLGLVGGGERRIVDIALGVVETESGLRIIALHRADHLRGEQDAVDRHHLGEQIDARLMIDAGVEEDVLAHDLGKLRLAVVERDAAEAAPVERHRAAAVRDDELQGREVLEQVRQDDLHEHHRVGVEIVGAGGVLRRIAATGDVDHRRHVELDHLLVERIPPLVGEQRRIEVAAGRVGIEVAADHAELLDAALELLDRRGRRLALRLRELADADEILREQ